MTPSPWWLETVTNILPSKEILNLNSSLTFLFAKLNKLIFSLSWEADFLYLRHYFPVPLSVLFKDVTENRHCFATVAERNDLCCLRFCHISYKHTIQLLALAHCTRHQAYLRKLPTGLVFILTRVILFSILFWEQFHLPPPTSSLPEASVSY